MSDLKLTTRDMEIISKAFQCFQSAEAMKVSQRRHFFNQHLLQRLIPTTLPLSNARISFGRAIFPHLTWPSFISAKHEGS